MEETKKNVCRVGNNRLPVYVSEDLNNFARNWRHHLGSHENRHLYVLLDENVDQAFPDLISILFEKSLFNTHVKKLTGGEGTKTITTAIEIWDELSALKADRSWVIVSIGGGTLSDLAGFIASLYKRGLPCVFLPSSLMAMIDASVGGKNALNQGVLKNQIGTYYFPEFIFVYPPFLKSLPQKEYYSGYAELIKHSLLHSNDNLWKKLLHRNMLDLPNAKLLADAIRIKIKIVEKDPYEKHQRLFLNFGHSFGHAIESYYNFSGKSISHGQAVTYGMQVALFLSKKEGFLSYDSAKKITDVLQSQYPFPKELEFSDFSTYLSHDKKVMHGKLRVILFKDFGKFDIVQFKDSELKELYQDFKMQV